MENVREITRHFPWWFSDQLSSYAERVEELPVDQECLLSLVAPAKLLVLSRDRDPYCDAQAEEKSVLHVFLGDNSCSVRNSYRGRAAKGTIFKE